MSALGNRLEVATLIVRALPYYVLGITTYLDWHTGPTNAGSVS
jgi:hypothetical protein